jgi:hypothetical protein
MAENRTSVSNAASAAEIGEYWDRHDLSDHWDQTHEASFEVAAESSVLYFAVDKTLAEKLRAVARTNGVSPETLLNVWVQEHLGADQPSK